MANFIDCSVPEIIHSGKVFANAAVNLDHVLSVLKSDDRYAPYLKGLKVISFSMIGGHFVDWVYISTAERDADYNRIIGGE